MLVPAPRLGPDEHKVSNSHFRFLHVAHEGRDHVVRKEEDHDTRLGLTLKHLVVFVVDVVLFDLSILPQWLLMEARVRENFAKAKQN